MNTTNPSNTINFLVLLLLLLASCSESPEQTYQRLEKTGNDHFAAQNYQKALESWNKMTTLKPATAALYDTIGDCYYNLALYHNALQAYKATVSLQSDNWQTHFKIARIHLTLMDLYSAEQSREQFRAHLSNDDTIIFYGDLLSLQKKHAEAEKEYRKILETNPQHQTAFIRLAFSLLAQGNKAESERVFNNLNALQKHSADVLLQMSNFASLLNNQQLAENILQKAITLAPNSPLFKIKLANLYIETGKYQQASSILQALQQLFPDNHYIKKLFIETKLLTNSDEEAWSMLSTLSEAEERDLEFNFLKGKYFLKNLNFHAALSQFQLVLEKEPKIPLAHYFLALSYLAGGQSNLAQKTLIKCLTLNPDFSEAELTLADTYFKNGNYSIAMEHATRINKREPSNYRSHMITGNIHLARQEYDEALNAFQNARQLHPNLIDPLYYMATAALLSGDIDSAIKQYELLLIKNQQLTDATIQLTYFLTKEEQSTQAIQFLQKAISNEPNNYLLYPILGYTHLSADNREEAKRAFTQALSAKPDMKPAFLPLFELHAEDPTQLEKLLHSAIAQDSNFHEALTRLANLYCKQNQPQKAITLLEEAVTAYPKSPQLANNLAWLYMEHQLQDIDEAMRLAQIAYEGLPGNATVTDTLGWIYFKKNMPTRAQWLLEEAKNLAPDNPIITAHLKALYQATQ